MGHPRWSAFVATGLVAAPSFAQPAPADDVQALRTEVEELRAEVAAERQAREDAQVQALVAEGAPPAEEEPAPLPVEEEKLSLYGFMDMGLQRSWGDEVSTTLAGSTETTFVLGNINLYIDAKPIRDWRALTEVRFTLFPQGSENSFESPLEPYTRTDTNVVDVTSAGGGLAYVQWGSIVLERAHIDYSAADWLTIRTGYFLTPYGIWNVDHGTPTLIALTSPAFVVVGMWPNHQTGVEAFGTLLSPPWTWGWHLYVSNGRTPTQVDVTDDKLLGGRLFVRTTRPYRMQLGLSGFAGSAEDQKKVVDDPVTLAVRREKVWAYDEQGLGMDLSVDVGDLRLRSEVLMRQVFYEPGFREPRFDFGPAADRREWGAYVMGAYRLPWAGLEPFAVVDFLRWPIPIGEALILPSIGCNVHFNEAVQLKMQWTEVRFFDITDEGHDHSDQALHFLAARLVVAY
jgi:hypothetical protein